MAKYDIIIKNGMVFDGKGTPPRQADVAISRGKIKYVGNLQMSIADKVIDAKGKYVAPGFIDMTSHSDTHWTIFSDASQESLLRQGITTILGGNCGSSLAPFVGDESAEEIGRWVDMSKTNINWRAMDEFLGALEKNKIGVNFATLVGFNTLQKAVIGNEVRILSEKEVNQMKLLFKKSLNAGAFGLSTNLGLSHARSLDDEDLVEIFKIVKINDGIIKHHLEDEGGNILPALSRVINIARRSGTKLHIGHFKALGKKSWTLFSSAIDMIRLAGQDGIRVSTDIFPYTKTGSSLVMILPSWFRNLPSIDKYKTLSSGGPRKEALIESLKKMTLHYDRITVASAGDLGQVGKTIEEISKSSGLTGETVILDLLEVNDCRVSIFNEVISEENVRFIAKEAFTAIATDGVGYTLPHSSTNDLPHPRSFGAFPKAFNLLVKEDGDLTWEEVVYKMSGLPATILGLKDRGVLVAGNKADVVVFDPDEIIDKATYEEPLQYSEGVIDVIVNGVVALENKKITGNLSGQVLRKK